MKKQAFILILTLLFGFITGWCVHQKTNSCRNDPKEELSLNETNEKYDYSKDISAYNPLTVILSENQIVNCDSAYTNLELNYCSGVKTCLKKKKFDSLNNVLLKIYDSLIIQQNKEIHDWKQEGGSSMIGTIIDYKRIKKLHIESILKFLEYASFEREIIGTEIGYGSLRTFYENQRFIDILDAKTFELNKQIQVFNE